MVLLSANLLGVRTDRMSPFQLLDPLDRRIEAIEIAGLVEIEAECVGLAS